MVQRYFTVTNPKMAIYRKNSTRNGCALRFSEIRFPSFESTELFQRGVGDTTDVVQKEMYTFEDSDDGKSFSLRPEGTASGRALRNRKRTLRRDNAPQILLHYKHVFAMKSRGRPLP